MEDSILFKLLTIGKLTISGRVIKAATSETWADKDGFATQDHIDFHLPMAKAGTPLIIQASASPVKHSSVGESRNPRQRAPGVAQCR